MKSLFLLATLLVLSLSISGQKKFPHPKIKHIDLTESLNGDKGEISDIQTDEDGFVWIIQQFRILKYDGKEFKTINTDSINSFVFLRSFQAKNGVRYVTSYFGDLYYIDDNDAIKPYEYNDTLKKLHTRSGLADIYFDDKNRLHVSNIYGDYYIIDKGKVSRPLKEKGIKIHGYACLLRENDLPFIIRVFDPERRGEQLHYYVLNQKLEIADQRPLTKTKYRYPSSIVQLPNKNYLFSPSHGNLFEFNKEGFIREIEYDSPIFRLFSDKQDNLWIGTIDDGLHLYKGGKIEPNNKEVFFPKKSAGVAAQDYEGGIWLYSDMEINLSYIENAQYRFYNKKNGLTLSNRVRAVHVGGKKIYSGDTGNKISITDTEHNSLDSQIVAINPKSSFTAIRYDFQYNRYWIAQRGGLYYLHNGSWKKLAIEHLPYGNNPKTMFLLSPTINGFDQSMVICSDYHFFTLKDTVIDYVSDRIEHRLINSIVKNDSIFLITVNGIYLHYNEQLEYLGDKHPILREIPAHACLFDNKLWFGFNDDGVFILQNDSLHKVEASGTLITNPKFVQKNVDSLFIFGTTGSFLFSRKGKPNHETGYELSSFLPISQFTRSSMTANNTTMFIGSSNQGVLAFDFKDVTSKPLEAPKLSLAELIINEKKQNLFDTLFSLNYDESFIQISYRGISFYSKDVNYRYRMLGLKDKWTLTKKDYNQFTTLPPGKYTFEVQCRRGEQLWSPPLFLHFDIAPPFWQTWWFIGLSILFFVSLFYFILSRRFKIAQREQELLVKQLQAEQKALRAQMDPHFVFNIISSAQYLIAESSREKANKFLDMFADSMRNILDQANTNFITIDNEIKFLTEYIQMERFRLEDQFDFEIKANFSEGEGNNFIPPFIIQPLVENAIHHGLRNKDGKGHLTLQFQIEQAFLKISITDNGIGRKEANLHLKNKSKKQSHGIRIIKERLSLHNKLEQNIIIEDLYNEKNQAIGTKINLSIRIITEWYDN